MQTANPTHSKKLQAGLALLVLSVALVGEAIVTRSRPVTTPFPVSTSSSQSPAPQSSVNTSKTPSPAPGTSSAASYADGSYSAVGSYDSPGGTESVKVSLTLAADTVTAVNVEPEANDPTAASYQAIFISGYKPFVVGKKVSSIKLTNVSGSSLTPQGFNNALQRIKQQAQA